MKKILLLSTILCALAANPAMAQVEVVIGADGYYDCDPYINTAYWPPACYGYDGFYGISPDWSVLWYNGIWIGPGSYGWAGHYDHGRFRGGDGFRGNGGRYGHGGGQSFHTGGEPGTHGGSTLPYGGGHGGGMTRPYGGTGNEGGGHTGGHSGGHSSGGHSGGHGHGGGGHGGGKKN